MKRRRLVRLLVLLAVLAALTVWLEPTRVVWGWLRGEAFYQGRPTSYWAERIRPWELHENVRSDVEVLLNLEEPRGRASIGPAVQGRQRIALRLALAPCEGVLRRWAKRWLPLPDIPWPVVLDGDPDAEAVLTELSHHEEAGIRDWGLRGLARIHTGQSGPFLRTSDLSLEELRQPLSSSSSSNLIDTTPFIG